MSILSGSRDSASEKIVAGFLSSISILLGSVFSALVIVSVILSAAGKGSNNSDSGLTYPSVFSTSSKASERLVS